MGKPPLVTVIVPSFNYGRFIAQTLKSVQQQTFRNFECVVVDDGSTDDTRSVVAETVGEDSRFRYVYQENVGMSAARNRGLREASGEYIQFLDSDDLLEKRKLELQVSFLEEHPQVDFVYGNALFFPSDEPEKRFHAMDGGDKSRIRKVSGGSSELLRALLVDNIFVICSPLLRKKLADRLGYFDEKMRTLEDWEYWLRCTNFPVRVEYLEGDDALCLIRFHPNSASRNRKSMLSTNVAIRSRLHPFLKERDLVILNRRGMANAAAALGVELIRNGEVLQGISKIARPSVVCSKIMAKLAKLRGN